MANKEDLRRQMVEEQIARRGIKDPAVLSSFLTVPRHVFVPEAYQELAYADSPLPIGQGQTISQPYIVALMTELAHVDKRSRVLEIGTGSGYAAAILAHIAAEVYTIERVEPLAKQAIQRFQQLNESNIFVKIGDGTLGWPEKGPYQAIVVTAGAPVVPEALLKQLAPQGRLIIPVGDHLAQQLCCYHKIDDKNIREEILDWVRFVPLIGEQGWKSE